jgi:hypothetical protein
MTPPKDYSYLQFHPWARRELLTLPSDDEQVEITALLSSIERHQALPLSAQRFGRIKNAEMKVLRVGKRWQLYFANKTDSVFLARVATTGEATRATEDAYDRVSGRMLRKRP